MMLCPLSNSFYYDSPWYRVVDFVELVSVLMILLVPPAICYMLWRIFVTNRLNPRGNICVLGLSETSATPAELYGRRISWWTFGLHVLTGLMTFKLGLLAFDFYYYVVALLE
jgi:hypothetical protein